MNENCGGISDTSIEIFSFSIQPLTILGVTGPFSVLAETMYSLSSGSLGVSEVARVCVISTESLSPDTFPAFHGLVAYSCRMDAPLTCHL